MSGVKFLFVLNMANLGKYFDAHNKRSVINSKKDGGQSAFCDDGEHRRPSINVSEAVPSIVGSLVE